MISPVSSSVADRLDRQVLPSHRLSLSENKIVNPCLLPGTSHMTDPVKKNFFQQVLLRKCSNGTCLILPSKTTYIILTEMLLTVFWCASSLMKVFLRDKVNHFGEFGEKNATDLTSMFSVMTASAALCVNAEFTWQTLHLHACEHCHCEHMTCAFSLMEHWLYFY